MIASFSIRSFPSAACRFRALPELLLTHQFFPSASWFSFSGIFYRRWPGCKHGEVFHSFPHRMDRLEAQQMPFAAVLRVKIERIYAVHYNPIVVIIMAFLKLMVMIWAHLSDAGMSCLPFFEVFVSSVSCPWAPGSGALEWQALEEGDLFLTATELDSGKW